MHEWVERYLGTRRRTEALAARLSPEDQLLQGIAEASPTKWHRAHTSWFFETFLLFPRGHAPYAPAYKFLFNSYYELVGAQLPRAQRAHLSRPSCDEITAYRNHVDDKVVELLQTASPDELHRVALGIAHEEQHQELILTDILNAFSHNPLEPSYAETIHETAPKSMESVLRRMEFQTIEGGATWVGAGTDVPFAFDNERPRHRVWVDPFRISTRLVTMSEVVAFIEDGGYHSPSLWLADGWAFVQTHLIEGPEYLRNEDGRWLVFGLGGLRDVVPDEPASNLSFYEAEAIARWLGGRLPTEVEWELAASSRDIQGNFLDLRVLRPLPYRGNSHMQFFGDVWEWTRSSYEPYPGYEPHAGALGEYNGKFMSGQQVLRGGSCLTPPGHIRATYRNFWAPGTRFQMTGLRIAQNYHRS